MWDGAFSEEPYAPPAETDGLFRLMEGSLETNWDFPYEALDRPVLLLTGLHDRLFRVDEDIAELKARLPDAQEKVYPDAGHLIPVEAPAEFSADLMDFAARLND